MGNGIEKLTLPVRGKIVSFERGEGEDRRSDLVSLGFKADSRGSQVVQIDVPVERLSGAQLEAYLEADREALVGSYALLAPSQEGEGYSPFSPHKEREITHPIAFTANRTLHVQSGVYEGRQYHFVA